MRKIEPKHSFYELFAYEQIQDLINNIEIHREVPLKYSYFGEGASLWDAYARRLMNEDELNAINSTPKLIKANIDYIDDMLSRFEKVNIVDITIGNAAPAKYLIDHILKSGKLDKYIAIDASKDILRLAEANLAKWFGGKVQFEGYEMDINNTRFSHLIRKEQNNPKETNLALYLGGTSHNFRSLEASFEVIHDSLSIDDYLIHTLKLDSPVSRKYFDFNPNPPTTEKVLSPRHELTLSLMDLRSAQLMSLSQADYDVEMDYDEKLRQRYVRIRLKEDVVLAFNIGGRSKSVELKKGETLLLLRMWHQTPEDVYNVLEKTEFDTLHTSQTSSQEYLMTISRIKRS